jgi:peptidoglycan/LPS O-acetylase OafA/YrhL
LRSRWGDLSSGVQLFGWPVEAFLNRVVTTGSGWELFAYSLPVTIALAGISWWVVERPCLRAKDAIQNMKALISARVL